MANRTFTNVSGLYPGRSVFDLSYEKKFNCDMGELIPIMCDEVVPGDTFKIGNEIVVRWQPLVAPILHEVNVYVHYFFCPYRLLWDEHDGLNSWEAFITGGPQGDLTPTLPVWDAAGAVTEKGKIWDFLGFPTDINPIGAHPLDFPRRAYNTIYNEYYRDETLASETALTNNNLLFRAWEKDYFTSALPWQQRTQDGPALPIVGTTSAVFTDTNWPIAMALNTPSYPLQPIQADVQANSGLVSSITQSGNPASGQVGTNLQVLLSDSIRDILDENTVDVSTLSSFNIADLRLAFQTQKFLERNARAGVRYTEFLKAHFGVAARDDRLDRMEYIGGTKSPVIISEVLQTSTTGYVDSPTSLTPQGNLAGHGITADRNFAGSYTVKEFGLIMGLMSVMPRSCYQQGINRQWLRQTKYDFYFPEFANLSEQAIENAEIYVAEDALQNRDLFGYQGRYDEMRVKQSMVCNDLRDTFDYWHLGRQFETLPTLNNTFITTKDNIRKDIFASTDEPGLIVNFGNKIKAIRPMPVASNPGLIDHH